MQRLERLACCSVELQSAKCNLLTSSPLHSHAPPQAAAKQPPGAEKHLHFQFYRNPVEILTDASGAAAGVKVEITQLQTNSTGAAVAVGTGRYEEHEAQLVLKSIGYKSLALEGVAFDARAGVIPNAAGRVLKGGSTHPCWAVGLTWGVAPAQLPACQLQLSFDVNARPLQRSSAQHPKHS